MQRAQYVKRADLILSISSRCHICSRYNKLSLLCHPSKAKSVQTRSSVRLCAPLRLVKLSGECTLLEPLRGADFTSLLCLGASPSPRGPLPYFHFPSRAASLPGACVFSHSPLGRGSARRSEHLKRRFNTSRSGEEATGEKVSHNADK